MKLEERTVGNITVKIFERLPYRLECKLESLIIKMAEGMEGKLSDFEDINFEDMDIADLKGFDMSKKMIINDFLLTNAILQPRISEEDLDNHEHELNNIFKELGDYLFNKYVDQYSEKMIEKKKLT